MPRYLEYSEIPKQLKEWNKKYPDLTDIRYYGFSSRHQPIYFIKITNPNSNAKKVVLIFSTIHGNESVAATTTLGFVGYTLYHHNSEPINRILSQREIYIVPAVSPDSYDSHSRHVNGVDPNRNFNQNPSVPPVEALKNLAKTIKPKAAISVHTFMRAFLIPWGEKKELCPDHEDYMTLLKPMCKASGYNIKRACTIYGTPIYGSELDWFYKRKCLTIVAEVGTHQEKPDWKDIETEVKKTYMAFLYFVDKAPEVKLND